MNCYKGKQFCKFWTECEHGSTCPRALTNDVREKATALNLPIDVNTHEPNCFTEKEDAKWAKESDSSYCGHHLIEKFYREDEKKNLSE